MLSRMWNKTRCLRWLLVCVCVWCLHACICPGNPILKKWYFCCSQQQNNNSEWWEGASVQFTRSVMSDSLRPHGLNNEKELQFSHSVMSNSLWPHGLQHPRPLCWSPTPRTCSNTCALSRWCHPIISSSVIPFSSCLQSFPASGCFPRSQLFASVGQSIGASASASVLSMNIQDWFPWGWTGWISFKSKVLSRIFSITTVPKHKFLVLNFLYGQALTSVHDYWKNHSFD